MDQRPLKKAKTSTKTVESQETPVIRNKRWSMLHDEESFDYFMDGIEHALDFEVAVVMAKLAKSKAKKPLRVLAHDYKLMTTLQQIQAFLDYGKEVHEEMVKHHLQWDTEKQPPPEAKFSTPRRPK